MEQGQVTNEKRHFMRVRCRIPAEFQLASEGDVWHPAEVLDLSIIGVRIHFDSVAEGANLSDQDVEWQDVRFRFKDEEASETIILNGHFLMVYERENSRFTTGVEFTDVTPDQQIKLIMLYTKYRQETGREE